MGKILEARYLNVDFYVEANFNLSPVVEALRGEVTVLWEETSEKSSSFGIESNLLGTDAPEKDIVNILHLLESLPREQKNMLMDCQKKTFDIGFECGVIDGSIDAKLSAKTVQRIAHLECCINIKLYPWVEHPYQ